MVALGLSSFSRKRKMRDVLPWAMGEKETSYLNNKDINLQKNLWKESRGGEQYQLSQILTQEGSMNKLENKVRIGNTGIKSDITILQSFTDNSENKTRNAFID